MSANKKVDQEMTGFASVRVLVAVLVISLLSFLVMKADFRVLVWSLSVELAAPVGDDIFQVFVDAGRGFNEGESVRASVSGKDAGTVTVRFSMPAREIRSLRIDTGTGKNTVTLRSVALNSFPFGYRWDAEQLAKDFLPANHIRSYSLENGLLRIDAAGHDPFIVLKDFGHVQETVNRRARILLAILAASIVLVNLFPRALLRLLRSPSEETEGVTRDIGRSDRKKGPPMHRLPATADSGSMQPSSFVRGLLIVILMLVSAAVLLGANPFRGETVAPVDLLFLCNGWKSLDVVPPVTKGERTDILNALLPNWVYLKNTLRAGELPLWNPLSSGGTPGIQNFSSGTHTPGFLAFTLTGDHALGFYFSSLIKLFFAGSGTYLLLRLFFTRIASFFGAVTYMACGFHAAWLYWNLASTSPWIPWLLWSLLKYLRSGDPRYLIGVTLTSLLLILGGFPVVAVYGFLAFAVLLAVINVACFEDRRTLMSKSLLPLAAVALAFVMAAYPLLSLGELLSQVSLGYRTGGTMFAGTRDLLLFLFPFLKGTASVETTTYAGFVPIVLCGLYLLCMNRQACSLLHRGDRLLAAFLVSFLLILAISLIVGFGLMDHNLIRKIPVIGRNPWNRLVVLVSLSLAVLSAFWVDCFVRAALKQGWIARGMTFALLVALTAYHFHDLRGPFSWFNPPVPGKFFFPHTKSTQYVADNLGPMQSVIADDSYMISGTLVTYGIPEWFAHNFKSEKEKSLLEELVKKPFVSPTAAMFPGDRVNIGKPLMDAFAIRYVMVNSAYDDVMLKRVVAEQPWHSRIPAPPLTKDRLVQYYRSDQDAIITGIAIPFSTYGRPSGPSDVTLVLREEPAQRIIGESTVKKDAFGEGRWVAFDFGRQVRLGPRLYSFELRLADRNAESPFTAWTTDRPLDDMSVLSVDGKRTVRSVVYKFYNGTKEGAEAWKRHRLEPAVTIFENTDCPQGAYLVARLDTPPEQIEQAGIKTTVRSNTEIVIDSRRPEPGWLVLPARAYPGWKAFKGATNLRVETYMGVFPAIWLDGPGTVIYKYRPMSLVYGAIVSLTGLIAFCVMILIVVKKCRRSMIG